MPVRQVESDGLARSGQIGTSAELFYIKNSGFKNYSEYEVYLNLSPKFKSEKIRCDREDDFCNAHFYVSGNKVIAWITKANYDTGKSEQANVQIGTINSAGDVTPIRPIIEAELNKPTRASALRGMITGFGPGIGAGSAGNLSVYIK